MARKRAPVEHEGAIEPVGPGRDDGFRYPSRRDDADEREASDVDEVIDLDDDDFDDDEDGETARDEEELEE